MARGTESLSAWAAHSLFNAFVPECSSTETTPGNLLSELELEADILLSG